MKVKVLHTALAVGALLLATNACDCGESLQTVAPLLELYYVGDASGAPDQAEMSLIPETDHLTVAFGMVDVGVVAHRYLFLHNSGTAPLECGAAEIDPATSTDFVIMCDGITDCAVSPASPLSTGAGGDLVVEIIYAPSESGPDTGAFSLTFNTLENKIITVDITGEAVTPEIQVCFLDCVGDEVDPACAGAADLCNDQVERDQLILDFGNVQMEASASRQVTVRNQGQKPLNVSQIELADSSHGQYSLDLAGAGLPGELQPGQETTLTVVFAPGWGGPHSDSLVVQSTDVNEPQVLVKLAGQGIAPRICPDPLLLDFGNVQVGVPVTQTFDLESCGLETLNLTDLRMAAGSSPDFSLLNVPGLPTNLAPGDRLSIEVEYYPQSAGSDSGGVDIFSNDQSADPDTGHTGTVVLRGNAVDRACDIQATPFAVNFGVVVLEDVATMDVVVANVGSDPCTISEFSITRNSAQDEFSLVNPPGAMTLDVLDTVTLTVQYNPLAPDLGQDTGIMSIFANDKDTNEVRIDLNGFSVPPEGDGPIAVCSVTPPQAVPFQTVTWDGSQSYDSNNRPITEYRWEIFAFPPGSGATLVGLGATRTSVVDFAGDYIASLVVVNDLGQTSERCYATTTVTPTQDLWIEMYWVHTGDDMDLHLLAPNGFRRTATDCYFGNCVPFTPNSPPRLEWGQAPYDGDDPRLDRDDIGGDGPENINISDPMDGTYTVFVHDYPGSSYLPGNEVTVKVYIDGVLSDTFVETVTGEDSDWDVCTVAWPSGVVTPL